MSLESGPIFRFSRDPVSALASASDRQGRGAAFARHGLATLDRFLRELASLRQVDYTDLRVDPYAFNDDLAVDFTCSVTIDIKFKRLSLIRLHGYGYGTSAREARLIALAESLERLGLCLQAWHDPAIENSNGACFHTSPIQALKGAFCELLERDTVLGAWYSGRALPVSRISRGHRLYPWVERFAADGWELREHCWLHDKVPAAVVAVSVMRREPARDRWNLFLGSAAAPRVNEARDKALKEMLKGRRQWSRWNVSTSGRATPARLRSVESRRILYQRPAFVRRFAERLAAPSRPVIRLDGALSDGQFIAQCLRNLPSARIVPLPLPLPFVNDAFCARVVCDELQGLDWEIPARYNLARLRELYRVSPREVCRLPHPLA